jgi:hypothetical protein
MNEGLLAPRRFADAPEHCKMRLKASLVGREGKRPLGPLSHMGVSECYYPPDVEELDAREQLFKPHLGPGYTAASARINARFREPSSPTADLFKDAWEPAQCAEPGTITFYERAFFSLSNFFGLGDAEAQQCLPWRSKLDGQGRPTRLRIAEVRESTPYTMIRSLFSQKHAKPKHPGTSTPKNYHLSRVELLENPRLELQFSEWLKSTSVKPTDGGHSEAAPVDVHDPVMAMKEQALARLRSLFLTEQTGWTRVRSTCNGEVLFGWVPVSPAEVYDCAVDGFADRPYPEGSHKDFGDGHPVMLDAPWACVNASEWPKPVAPNKKGEFCVLLCLVGVYRTYPITPCQDDFPAGSAFSEDCILREIGAPFDSHFVGIGGNANTAVPPSLSENHLLIVKDGMQLLPLAIAWFKLQ